MKKATTIKRERGKRFTLYIRDADLARVRELTAYAAGQGERTSDSLIIRACVLAATPGKAFLSAYREVAAADLRFRQD
jgi:hypothetical protein